MRKRIVTALLAVLLAAGCAGAEIVTLPESRYAVTLPEDMVSDGPTEGTGEAFARVSEAAGLEVSFFRFEGPEASLSARIAVLLEQGAEELTMTTVNGVEMLVFRFPPEEENGMPGIGYVFEDGDALQEILFWYATPEAAEMTKTIMESIEGIETV